MKPNDLLRSLKAHLAATVTANKGQLILASSAFNVIELLGESPAGFRVILLWNGDEDATGQPAAGIVYNHLHAIVSHNRGLRIWSGEAAVLDAGTQKALLTHVHLIRDAVRAWEAPADQTDQQALYLGCEPEVTPDGLPVDAYRLKFRLTSNVL